MKRDFRGFSGVLCDICVIVFLLPGAKRSARSAGYSEAEHGRNRGLIWLVKGTDTLRFSYDAAGNAAAVNHNGTYYYYLRNGWGDVVKLIDGSRNTVVEYAYDSWGKPLSCTGTLATTLGALNPFRYRGSEAFSQPVMT